MALVLRKAVLPKNVSLLKCIRGRPLGTASNKKNPAALSTAVQCRSLRDKARKLLVGSLKIEKTEQLPTMCGRGRSHSPPLLFSVSCPVIVPDSRTRYCASPRHFSPPRTRPIRHDNPFARNSLLSMPKTSSLPCWMHSNQFHTTNMYDFAKACPPPCSGACPCPFPCGPCGNCSGCSCLPPPCNQPPKCIQYMTGYYYYPYGFWFCGPYHVTGTCTPVGPSGPCPQCCPPATCAKCCACLNPVAAAVVSATPTQAQVPQRTMSRPIQPTSARDIKSSLPSQDSSQSKINPRSSISKFFPFNVVPPVQGIKKLHSKIENISKCPYSTAPNSTAPNSTAPNSATPNNNPPYSNPPYSNPPYSNPAYSNPAYSNAPYSNAPYSNAPYSNAPYSNAPYSTAQYSTAAYSNAPYSNAPYSTTQYSTGQYSSSPNSAVPNSAEPNSAAPYSTTTYSAEPYSAYTPFREQNPVYLTPCIKHSKNNFSSRPRQPFLNNNLQKSKRSLPKSLSKSWSDYYEKRSESRSPIHHKRSKKKTCEVSPILENPRVLLSQEERDMPDVYPGAFQYGNIPKYRRPSPRTCYYESNFVSYDA